MIKTDKVLRKRFKISKEDASILYKRSRGEKVIYAIVFLIFAVYAISLIFPFLWLLVNSFQNKIIYQINMSEGNAFAFPKKFEIANYIYAFKELSYNGSNIFNMFFNSIWLAFAGTFCAVMVSSATAYVIAKYKFRGNSFLYKVAIFTMIIPIVGNLPAMYKLVLSLGLDNPIGILALYAGGFGFNFIILHGFYRSLSWTYAEAGFVDGASDWWVYWKIMLPQAKSAIIAISILSCIGIWNDYLTPFLYLKNSPTLALGIYQFEIVQEQRSNVPIYYSAILLSIIPILSVFVFFQKTIMENTVAGGIKG